MARVMASSRSTMASHGVDWTGDDRLPGVLGRALGRHQPALDVLDDRRRILGPRVVRGQDHQVAEARRHGAHQRTLGAVAIAAAAEHRDDALRRQRARRLEQVLQRIVGVGVVDDDADVVLGARDELEAARARPARARGPLRSPPAARRARRRRRPRRARCRRWAVRAAACADASVRPASAAPRRCRRASASSDVGQTSASRGQRVGDRPADDVDSRSPRGSSTLMAAGASGGSISNSRRLAAKYASMSPW